MQEPTITIETITPEMAYAWLETNTSNRAIRHHKVQQYARDMKSGRWYVTGDPICFNGDDGLKNGQHRLWACIEANTPFRSAVLRGLADEAHAAMDVGATRTMADELRWRRESNGAALGATLTLIWSHWHGALLDPRLTPSRSEQLEILERNPEIRASMPIGQASHKMVKIPVSVCAGMHFLFSKSASDEDATGFFYLLRTEGAAEPNTGPMALRRYAINTYMMKSKRPTQAEWVALTTKAWNAWVTGTPVKQLRWRRGGAQAEPFPQIAPTPFVGESDDEGE